MYCVGLPTPLKLTLFLSPDLLTESTHLYLCMYSVSVPHHCFFYFNDTKRLYAPDYADPISAIPHLRLVLFLLDSIFCAGSLHHFLFILFGQLVVITPCTNVKKKHNRYTICPGTRSSKFKAFIQVLVQ